MSKQSFVTGQVLTAAQLTNLQQTAMLGGDAVTKTASYVLVAADAGSTVAMTSASATTITVNTGLFAAGDTVFIQNRGSGNLTVTAGTATVATAGSLILPQNDAGILYFTATGASIFYDFIQVGAASPLTTKGDLYTFGTSDTRLGVGANDTILVADSSEATGLKWAAPAGATKNFTLLNAGGTALTGAATITISGISGKDQIFVMVEDASSATASSAISVKINAITTNQRSLGKTDNIHAANNVNIVADSRTTINLGIMSSNQASQVNGIVNIFGCNTAGTKMYQYAGGASLGGGTAQENFVGGGRWDNAATVSSIVIVSSAGDFDGGTVRVYASA